MNQKPLRLKDEIPTHRVDPLGWLKWLRRRGFQFWVYLGLGTISFIAVLGMFIPVARKQGQLDFRGPPDIEVSLSTSEKTVAANSEFEYAIIYTNVGGSEAGSVTVDVMLPEEVTLVNVVPGNPACALGSNLKERWAILQLSPEDYPAGGMIRCLLGTRLAGLDGQVVVTVKLRDAPKGTPVTANVFGSVSTTRDYKKLEEIFDNNHAEWTVSVQ
tara:strand:- start:765 stop:1409 length:645 start_codon:yes stop_codon:yes gene_type:complete